MTNKSINQTPQAKSRQTKLEKKSHEELVAIVLKKDKIEKNLNTQIVNLKSEVNTLTTLIAGYQKDIRGNTDIIEDWKNRYNEKCDLIDALNDSIVSKANECNEYKALYEAEYKANTELSKTNESLSKIAWTSVIFGIIAVIGWIFC